MTCEVEIYGTQIWYFYSRILLATINLARACSYNIQSLNGYYFNVTEVSTWTIGGFSSLNENQCDWITTSVTYLQRVDHGCVAKLGLGAMDGSSKHILRSFKQSALW